MITFFGALLYGIGALLVGFGLIMAGMHIYIMLWERRQKR